MWDTGHDMENRKKGGQVPFFLQPEVDVDVLSWKIFVKKVYFFSYST